MEVISGVAFVFDVQAHGSYCVAPCHIRIKWLDGMAEWSDGDGEATCLGMLFPPSMPDGWRMLFQHVESFGVRVRQHSDFPACLTDVQESLLDTLRVDVSHRRAPDRGLERVGLRNPDAVRSVKKPRRRTLFECPLYDVPCPWSRVEHRQAEIVCDQIKVFSVR